MRYSYENFFVSNNYQLGRSLLIPFSSSDARMLLSNAYLAREDYLLTEIFVKKNNILLYRECFF